MAVLLGVTVAPVDPTDVEMVFAASCLKAKACPEEDRALKAVSWLDKPLLFEMTSSAAPRLVAPPPADIPLAVHPLLEPLPAVKL